MNKSNFKRFPISERTFFVAWGLVLLFILRAGGGMNSWPQTEANEHQEMEGSFAFSSAVYNHGEMLSSAAASIPAITETPQTSPLARGGGSYLFSKLSASSLLKQRAIENTFKRVTAINCNAKSASLEPLKRYFVFAIREIIV